MSVKRCPRCGFIGHFKILAVAQGEILEAAAARREVCPNDGVDLVCVGQAELDEWKREGDAKCAADGHPVNPFNGWCLCRAVQARCPCGAIAVCRAGAALLYAFGCNRCCTHVDNEHGHCVGLA